VTRSGVAPARQQGLPSGPAELLLVGGAVYTVDAARRWAEAVAIAGGRIVAVGAASELGELRGPDTRVWDCHGRLVLPGFQDAHVHALWGGLEGRNCDLHDGGDAADLLATIASYAEAHPERDWVVGGGWSMDAFPGGTPHRAELDAVVPDRPALLLNRDAHGAWVNSAALELAGITAATPDPPGGRIERDEHGEPMGTLHEHAVDLVSKLAPTPTDAALREGLRDAQKHLHALGITSWQDPLATEREVSAYRAVDQAGELTARVLLDLLWERDEGLEQLERLRDLRSSGTAGRVRATGVKIFQDGVAENFTAAMLEPYLDGAGGTRDGAGISMIEPASLDRFVTELDAAGFQVHFHAIGDRAVRESLDAVGAARRANGPRDARHHICHLQVLHPDDIPRFRRLGVVANCQPFWACHEPQMDDLTIPFLGPERSARQYPFASLRRSGAVLAFGSDWTVSTANPLLEIEVATTRTAPTTRDAEPFIPHERLDLPASLDAFTIGSAFVNHHDHVTGSIEPGKLADLVVLDGNPFEPDSGFIGDLRVVATFVDGSAVFLDDSVDW
jgi:predicted amidohydrolase YtcJ